MIVDDYNNHRSSFNMNLGGERNLGTIYIGWFLGKIALMAQRRPRSLKQLAEALSLELDDIFITCFYCQRFLTQPEKVLFVHSDLGIHFSNDCYYAACQGCIRNAARVDFLANYQGLISIAEAEALFAKRFVDIDVRCWTCLRQLNVSEKTEAINRQADIAVIRDQARTKCTLCHLGLP